jgi:putative transposase
MARPLRLEFSGALYHITARGNAQHAIFLSDADREQFIRLLGSEVRQQHWRCYVYCCRHSFSNLSFANPRTDHFALC